MTSKRKITEDIERKPKTKPIEDPAVWAGREKGKPCPAATYRGARRNKLKGKRTFLEAAATKGARA